jgi:hypothetical protein
MDGGFGLNLFSLNHGEHRGHGKKQDRIDKIFDRINRMFFVNPEQILSILF